MKILKKILLVSCLLIPALLHTQNAFAPTAGLFNNSEEFYSTDYDVVESNLFSDTRPSSISPISPSNDVATVLFSPATNKVFVNGAMFDRDNASAALESLDKLYNPPSSPEPIPTGITDWQSVTPASFGKYIKGIREPGGLKLLGKGFKAGAEGLKTLVGSGLHFLGREETGQGIIDRAVERIRKDEPYHRRLSKVDVGSDTNGAIDWLIYNIGRKGNIFDAIFFRVLRFKNKGMGKI